MKSDSVTLDASARFLCESEKGSDLALEAAMRRAVAAATCLAAAISISSSLPSSFLTKPGESPMKCGYKNRFTHFWIW